MCYSYYSWKLEKFNRSNQIQIMIDSFFKTLNLLLSNSKGKIKLLISYLLLFIYLNFKSLKILK